MMVTRSALEKRRLPDYSDIEPLPDPPKRPDMEQFDVIKDATAALDPRLRRRKGYLVSGGGYLRSSPEDMGDFVPDVIVVRDVEDPERVIRRNGYVISEVGKPPDFVLEVGSRSTGRRDYTVKRAGYARYGVGEYWRFDPSGGKYHDAHLGGDKLVDGEYERIEIVSESATRHWGYSEALELEVWWYEGRIRFRDPVAGEFLPNSDELQDAAEAAQARVESERVARELAEAQVEFERAARESAERRIGAERAARESAERRMAEMEAELRRLRGEEG